MAFPIGWGRKQKITIQSSQVIGSGSHSNFPFLVTLDHLNSEVVDTGIHSALTGGGDIRFSADSGGVTQLACEIVTFTPNVSAPSRACEIWVKVPSVSTSVNTEIFIWYKKTGESQPAVTATHGRNAVWTDYEFVTHDFITDSSGKRTISAFNGSTTDTSPWGGYAIDLNGSNQYLSASLASPAVDISGNLTVTIWGKANGSDSYPSLLHMKASGGHFGIATDTAASAAAFHMYGQSGTGNTNSVGRGAGFGTGTWGKIQATETGFDAAEILRVDKTQYTSIDTAWPADSGTDIMFIGTRGGNSNFFNGSLAELRIQELVRSPEWGDTEYNNQINPSTFANAGTPEAVSGEISLVIADAGHDDIGDGCDIVGGEAPIDYVGGVSGSQGANLTSISLTLPAHQADDFAVAFCYGDEAGTIGTWSETVATGWSQLREDNHQTGRDRVTAIFYKTLGASETNPTFAFSATEEHSASVNIFRNVDKVTPFDVTETLTSDQNDATPPNAAITTANDHSALVVMHASTHDDITTAAAPSGFELGTAINGAAFDNRQQIVAYQLSTGAAGLKSPGDWAHTVSVAATAEYSCYTLALRMAVGGETGLIVTNSTHDHVIDHFALSQSHDLTVSMALHGHAAPFGTLIEHKILVTAQLLHGLASDNIALDLSLSLVVPSSVHGHGSDQLSLGQSHNIAVGAALHDLISDQVNINADGAIAVQSSLHNLLSSGLSLGYSTDLVVDDAVDSHFAAALLLNQIHVLTVAGSEQLHAAQTLLFQTEIGGADALHGLVNDEVGLAQVHVLGDLDDTLDHWAGQPYVRIPPGIWEFVGEVLSGWNEQAEKSSSWTEQARGTDDWSDT